MFATALGLFKIGAMSVLLSVLALALKATLLILLALTMAVMGRYALRWLGKV
jgi:hypothetical protein